MKQGHFEQHWRDEEGNPTSGVSSGRGFAISWQNGPLGRDDERQEPNGAFVEDVIAAVIGPTSSTTSNGPFACDENKAGSDVSQICRYRQSLDARTKNREARGVEGTHQE